MSRRPTTLLALALSGLLYFYSIQTQANASPLGTSIMAAQPIDVIISPVTSAVQLLYSLVGWTNQISLPASELPETETADVMTQTPRNTIPNKYVVLLKPKVDTKRHLDKLRQTIKDKASRDNVKSSIDGTQSLNTLGIYFATLGSSTLSTLKTDVDVDNISEDIYVDTPSSNTAGTVAPLSRWRESGRSSLWNFGFEVTKGTWNLFRLTRKDPVKPGTAGQGTSVNTMDWDFRQDTNAGQGVIVYVVDSGINAHDDFGERLKPGFNVINPGNPTSDTKDNDGHGTAVAGLVSGMKTGVAKAVEIVPVKTFEKRGPGLNYPMSVLIEAFNQIIVHHQGRRISSVINISATLPMQKPLFAVVQKALESNLHIVSTAGNGIRGGDGIEHGIDNCASTMTGDDGVIVVGATDVNDNQAVFSNFGECVDLYAPGKDIVVPASTDKTNYFMGLEGTSLTAPLVAGFLASAIKKIPNLTPTQGKQQLLDLTLKGAIHFSSEAKAVNTPNRLLQIPQS